jgi:hypothetical protein
MSISKTITASVTIVFLAGAASAAVLPLGPFVGDTSETWESFQNYIDNPNFYEDAFGPVSILGGNASIANAASGAGGSMVIYDPNAAGFGLSAYGSAQVSDGVQGMGINTGFPALATTITFTVPVTDFGGYWGVTNETSGPADPMPVNFEFYDVNGAMIGSDVLMYSAPNADGALMWAGWNSSTPIGSVVYSGDYTVNDGLQANLVPAPGAAALLGLGGLMSSRRRRA